MPSYLIKNCNMQYMSKNMAWICDHSAPLFHTPHKDVALNQLVEVNSKDIQLRAEVVSCDLDAKGRPILPSQETAA